MLKIHSTKNDILSKNATNSNSIPRHNRKSKSEYWCQCTICTIPPKKLAKPIKNITKMLENICPTDIKTIDPAIADNKKYEKLKQIGGKQINLSQFLNYMRSKFDYIKGAPIFISETITFNNGKPAKLYKFNKNLLEIQCFTQENFKQFNLINLMKIMLNSYKGHGQTSKNCPMVIIRYNDFSSKLLTEPEFIKFMMNRPSDKQWKNIEYIQSYITCGKMLASIFNFEYNAEINFKKPYETLYYSIANFKEDEILKNANTAEYANKIFNKIGYYLSKVHDIELLSMKTTFLQDDSHNLWLLMADNIFIRENKNIIQSQSNSAKLIRFLHGVKDSVLADLENSCRVEDEVEATQIVKIMDTNYNKMKLKTGIQNLTKEKLEDELEVDQVFDTLYPASPYKMSEMISPKFNPRKTNSQRPNFATNESVNIAEMTADQVREMFLYRNNFEYQDSPKRCLKTSTKSHRMNKSLNTTLLKNDNIVERKTLYKSLLPDKQKNKPNYMLFLQRQNHKTIVSPHKKVISEMKFKYRDICRKFNPVDKIKKTNRSLINSSLENPIY